MRGAALHRPQDAQGLRPRSELNNGAAGCPAARSSAMRAKSSPPRCGAMAYDNNREITPQLGRRPRAEARRIRENSDADRSHADLHRARHLLGHVERALLVQILEKVAAHAADHRSARHPGPGRKCRRGRYRRRPGDRLQDGIAQPPSFIEPYQGAATGMGGILRDVFTMGARPVAAMNALRFGAPEHEKTRHLVSGVVAGIGGYGNSFGVPDGGRRGRVRRPLQRQHSGQRLRRRPGRHRQDFLFQGRRRRPARRLSRRQDRPRRRRRRHHGVGRIRRRHRAEAPDRAGRRSVHRKAPARGLPRADGDRRGDRHPGYGRRRAHLLGRRDGGQGRPRHRARSRPGAGARSRDDALRDDAERKPGAHAHGAASRKGSRGQSGVPEMGARFRHRWPHH